MWRVLFHFSEKGPRAENQDAVFCRTASDGLAVVAVLCDGVGGSPCGATASALASGHLGNAMSGLLETKQPPDENILLEYVNATLRYMHDEILRQPACRGMATTLTALVASDNKGVWHLHAGDSRIYHIRRGRILRKTEDHTPVNDLLRHGIITPEEAAASPRSSHISRALKTGDLPSLPPEIGYWDALLPGDLLFLCSDGVWAYVEESEWMACLSEAPAAPAEAAEKLRALCASQARDNFSAILLTLQSVSNL